MRKDRFSVALELNALLYLGVLAIAAGLLWTVQTHFIALGDTAIVAALTVIVALCFGYCFARARPYSPGEVESPTAIFDYVLYLGCLVFAIELAYLETRFTLLGERGTPTCCCRPSSSSPPPTDSTTGSCCRWRSRRSVPGSASS